MDAAILVAIVGLAFTQLWNMHDRGKKQGIMEQTLNNLRDEFREFKRESFNYVKESIDILKDQNRDKTDDIRKLRERIHKLEKRVDELETSKGVKR